MGKLTAPDVEAAEHDPAKRRPIRFHDGRGLHLQVATRGSKSWVSRYMRRGRSREMGLGPAGGTPGRVTLEGARALAAEARALLRQGIDPIDERRAVRAAEPVDSPTSTNPETTGTPPVENEHKSWRSEYLRRKVERSPGQLAGRNRADAAAKWGDASARLRASMGSNPNAKRLAGRGFRWGAALDGQSRGRASAVPAARRRTRGSPPPNREHRDSAAVRSHGAEGLGRARSGTAERENLGSGPQIKKKGREMHALFVQLPHHDVVSFWAVCSRPGRNILKRMITLRQTGSRGPAKSADHLVGRTFELIRDGRSDKDAIAQVISEQRPASDKGYVEIDTDSDRKRWSKDRLRQALKRGVCRQRENEAREREAKLRARLARSTAEADGKALLRKYSRGSTLPPREPLMKTEGTKSWEDLLGRVKPTRRLFDRVFDRTRGADVPP